MIGRCESYSRPNPNKKIWHGLGVFRRSSYSSLLQMKDRRKYEACCRSRARRLTIALLTVVRYYSVGIDTPAPLSVRQRSRLSSNLHPSHPAPVNNLSLSIVPPIKAWSAFHFSLCPPSASSPSPALSFLFCVGCAIRAKFRPNLSISTPSILRFRFIAPGRFFMDLITILPPLFRLLLLTSPSSWVSEKPSHSPPSSSSSSSGSASRRPLTSSAAGSLFRGRLRFLFWALALEMPESRTRVTRFSWRRVRLAFFVSGLEVMTGGAGFWEGFEAAARARREVRFWGWGAIVGGHQFFIVEIEESQEG